MIPTAIIGYGLAARVFHAPVIRAVSGLSLTTVVQRRGDPPQGLRLFRSVDEMLQSGDIRLAVVATPNVSHYEIARKCLEAGLHVVVDKPFTTTYAEAVSLIQVAEERSRVLTVHHNRRWDSDFLTIRKLIQSGVLGRIVMVESNYDRFRPALREGAWRERNEPGGGILFDLGSHLVDQALVLFGEPDGITADVRVERDGAVVDDAFDLTFRYPNLRVYLRASMLAATPRARFRIHGTHSTFESSGWIHRRSG
jgi:predicted dehydrogenase